MSQAKLAQFRKDEINDGQMYSVEAVAAALGDQNAASLPRNSKGDLTQMTEMTRKFIRLFESKVKLHSSGIEGELCGFAGYNRHMVSGRSSIGHIKRKQAIEFPMTAFVKAYEECLNSRIKFGVYDRFHKLLDNLLCGMLFFLLVWLEVGGIFWGGKGGFILMLAGLPFGLLAWISKKLHERDFEIPVLNESNLEFSRIAQEQPLPEEIRTRFLACAQANKLTSTEILQTVEYYASRDQALNTPQQSEAESQALLQTELIQCKEEIAKKNGEIEKLLEANKLLEYQLADLKKQLEEHKVNAHSKSDNESENRNYGVFLVLYSILHIIDFDSKYRGRNIPQKDMFVEIKDVLLNLVDHWKIQGKNITGFLRRLLKERFMLQFDGVGKEKSMAMIILRLRRSIEE